MQPQRLYRRSCSSVVHLVQPYIWRLKPQWESKDHLARLPHFLCSPIPSLWSCVLAATEKAKHPACFLCHLLMTGRAATSNLWSQRHWQGRMLQWLTWEQGWHTGDSRICLATMARGPGMAKRSHKTAAVGKEHRWSCTNLNTDKYNQLWPCVIQTNKLSSSASAPIFHLATP